MGREEIKRSVEGWLRRARESHGTRRKHEEKSETKMRTTKCREERCKEEFVWLKTEKAKNCPVDVESLSEEDVELLELGEEVIYRPREHVSHFKTCKNPGRF